MSLARTVSDNFPVSPTKTVLTGNGTTTVFTINGSPGLINPNELIVTLDGAVQEPTTDYTINGNTITFTSAPDNGAKIVVVYRNSPYILNLSVPPDGSITNSKIAAATIYPAQMYGNLNWNSDGSILTKSIYTTDDNFFIKNISYDTQISFNDVSDVSLFKIRYGNVGINTDLPNAQLEITPVLGQLEILKLNTLNDANAWYFLDQGAYYPGTIGSPGITLASDNGKGDLVIRTDGNTVFSKSDDTPVLSINHSNGEIRSITTAKAWIKYNTSGNSAVENAAGTINTIIPQIGLNGGVWSQNITTGGWTSDYIGLIYRINVGGVYGNLGGVGGYNFYTTTNLPIQSLYPQFNGYHKTAIQTVGNDLKISVSGGGSDSFYGDAVSNKNYIGTYNPDDNSINWVESNKLRPRRIVALQANSTTSAYSNYGNSVEESVNTTWTTSTNLPASTNWKKITYGKNRFVAITSTSSTTNQIAYSLDNGATWTAATIPGTAVSWVDITYGNNAFFAISENGWTAWSVDAVNWTRSAGSMFGSGWTATTFGNGRYVSINGTAGWSDTRTIVNAPNAFQNFPIGYVCNSIISGIGRFVTLPSNGNRTLYSPDGDTWGFTSSNLPDTKIWNGAYGNGKFVAVAYDINNTNIAAYASDTTNITWIQTTLPVSKRWIGVTYGQERFTALAEDGTLSYSNDGITWSSTTQNLAIPGTGITWSCIATLNDFMSFANHTHSLLNDGRLLITGGNIKNNNNINGLSNRTFFGTLNYTNNTINWSEGTRIPSTFGAGLMGHTINQLGDNRILSIGGFTFSNTTSAYVTTQSCNFGTIATNTITWVAGTNITPVGGLAYHTTTLLQDGRLLVIGGFSSTGNGNQTYNTAIYLGTIATNTITWTAATLAGITYVPLARHDAVFVSSNRVVIFGGKNSSNVDNNIIYNLTISTNTITISKLATLPTNLSKSGISGELMSIVSPAAQKLLLLNKNPYVLDFQGSPVAIKLVALSGNPVSTTGYSAVKFEFVSDEVATDNTPIVGTGTTAGFSFSTDGVYSSYNILSVSRLATGRTRITFQTPFNDQFKIIMSGSARIANSTVAANANPLISPMYLRPGVGSFNPTTNYADVVTVTGSTETDATTVDLTFYGV